jgi:autotransporter-associated beta strand protein/predicted outer membrane repeat protein
VTITGALNATGNSAVTNGGAIYTGSNLTLNATTGDMTFHDNTAAGGAANAVYLNGVGAVVTLNAGAGRTIGFFDPMASRATAGAITVRETGGGTVLFDGSDHTSQADLWSKVYANTTIASGTTFIARNGAIYGVQQADVGGADATSFTVDGTATLSTGGGVRADAVSAGTNGTTGVINVGAASGSTPAAPGTLVAATVTLGDNGSLVFNHTSTDLVFAPLITGTGPVLVLAGTTIFTTDDNYTGGTIIARGATLRLGIDGPAGTIAGNVLNDGTLEFNHSDTLIFTGVISGMGAVDQIGHGITIWTGANSYSGPTSVALGTLQAGAVNTFSPASAMFVADVGTLDLAGFNQVVASLTNAGLVNFSTSTSPRATLTSTGNYDGQGGTFVMHTVLGSDDSPTDKLVAGSTSGNTNVQIINAGGLGAKTTGNGIEIVHVTGGPTASNGTFRHVGSISAGA